MFSVDSLCSLFADVFNLFLLTQRLTPSGRFWRWYACMSACLKPPTSKHTWQQKIVVSGEEKRGLILTDCHRKIPVKTTFFSFFVVYICTKSFCLPHEGMPLSQFQNIWLALAWLYCLFPPLPPPTRHQPQRSILWPCPTTKDPSNRERGEAGC